MKIVLLTPEYPPEIGGISRSAYRIANGLVQKNIQVLVITRLKTKKHHTHTVFNNYYKEEQCGIPVYYFPHHFHIYNHGPYLKTISHILDSFAPDIIYSYSVDLGYLANIFANKFGIPSVVSCRGADITTRSISRTELNKYVLESASFVTSVATSLLHWGNLYANYKSSSPVFNSIESSFVPSESPTINRDRYGISRNAIVIGSNAKFRWKKNISYLKTIFQRAAESNLEELVFVLIGRFPKEIAEEWQVLEKSSSKSRKLLTIFTPCRKELPNILSCLDLFISTSKREGMPNTILEAMACGVRVAATEADGCVDILSGQSYGLLLDLFDPEKGAQQVITMLERIKQWKPNNSQQHMKTKYNVEREVQDVRNICQYLIDVSRSE